MNVASCIAFSAPLKNVPFSAFSKKDLTCGETVAHDGILISLSMLEFSSSKDCKQAQSRKNSRRKKDFKCLQSALRLLTRMRINENECLQNEDFNY